MERRPSATMRGMDAKLESNSTRELTFFAASDPDAIATEQSASLSASTSLTPSPVIATVCPAALSALTRVSFWSGRTRPNTVYFVAASRTSSSVVRVDMSMMSSHFSSPARFATARTVEGLSPEMILTATPCSRKKRRVSGASSRILSVMKTNPSNDTSSGNLSSSNGAFDETSASTR